MYFFFEPPCRPITDTSDIKCGICMICVRPIFDILGIQTIIYLILYPIAYTRNQKVTRSNLLQHALSAQDLEHFGHRPWRHRRSSSTKQRYIVMSLRAMMRGKIYFLHPKNACFRRFSQGPPVFPPASKTELLILDKSVSGCFMVARRGVP